MLPEGAPKTIAAIPAELTWGAGEGLRRAGRKAQEPAQYFARKAGEVVSATTRRIAGASSATYRGTAYMLMPTVGYRYFGPDNTTFADVVTVNKWGQIFAKTNTNPDMQTQYNTKDAFYADYPGRAKKSPEIMSPVEEE